MCMWFCSLGLTLLLGWLLWRGENRPMWGSRSRLKADATPPFRILVLWWPSLGQCGALSHFSPPRCTGQPQPKPSVLHCCAWQLNSFTIFTRGFNVDVLHLLPWHTSPTSVLAWDPCTLAPPATTAGLNIELPHKLVETLEDAARSCISASVRRCYCDGCAVHSLLLWKVSSPLWPGPVTNRPLIVPPGAGAFFCCLTHACNEFRYLTT